MDFETRAFAEGKMLASAKGGVGYITFNQPEKRNAMSMGMWAGLGEILAIFNADPGLRVVILTGAGDKAFVSGADISQFDTARGDSAAQAEYDRLTREGRAAYAAFRKPMIAKIRGFCLGGGLAIAMQADLRIAADTAQFGIPAAKLGISYSYPSLRMLVSLVGPAEARMLLYTAERIPAAEARSIGLINRCVPEAELDETVDRLAATIAGNAPLSVVSMKRTITEATRDEAACDMEAVKAAIAECFNSEDYKEGRAAFKEKRKPVFQGK
jgi:enoyl-CoA hydratase/carnithine racemase